MNKSLQEIIHPEGVCFGCGPANGQGLHIKSYWDDEEKYVVARMTPEERFCSLPGLVYGGYLAMLVDCHSGWTANANHYKAAGREPGSLPRLQCVTGKLGVKYIKPTPLGPELFLRAWVEGELARKSRIICEIYVEDTLTVQGDSIFALIDPESFVAKR